MTSQRFVPHTGTAPLWGGKVNGNAPFSPLIPQNVTSNSSDNQEVNNWKSQNATSKSAKMGLRKAPYAFTENGVAMLSSEW